MGITTNPTDPWLVQVARNMTDTADGTLLGKRYLILDRDTKYSASFHKSNAIIKGSKTAC